MASPVGQRDVPPRPYQDSARSWIVAVAGAWTLFWVMILSSCSGIIFVTIVSEMGASREAASWPFNLLAAVINVSGVVAGLLLRTFPLRAVSMAGSLLTALGVLLCAVFYDVTGITVCFGVLCGFGQGLIFPSNDLAVNTYFIKYRASGSGISWAGGSLVALVFPSVVVYLNDVYGLRGTFVVVGGLTLNAAAGSLLIHNPEALARQSQSTAYRRRSDGHWPGTGNRQLSGVRFYEVAPNACEENQLETDDSETAASAPLMSTKSEVKAKYQDGNSAARASQHSYGAARWDTGIPSNRKGPPEHSVDAEGDVGNNNTTGLIRKAMFAFRNELGFLKRPITYYWSKRHHRATCVWPAIGQEVFAKAASDGDGLPADGVVANKPHLREHHGPARADYGAVRPCGRQPPDSLRRHRGRVPGAEEPAARPEFPVTRMRTGGFSPAPSYRILPGQKRVIRRSLRTAGSDMLGCRLGLDCGVLPTEAGIRKTSAIAGMLQII